MRKTKLLTIACISTLAATTISSAEVTNVHVSQVPWFIADQDSLNGNATGGSFAIRDAYDTSLSRVLFNGRELTSAKTTGDEIDTNLLSTGEFSRLGATSQYILWLADQNYNASDPENLVASRVNIDLQNPLEARPGFHIGTAGAYNYNADDVYDSDGVGGQAGVTYVEQYFDDSLGVMFIANFERLPVADLSTGAWYDPYWDSSANRPLYGPGGFEGGAEGGHKDYWRNFFALQWAPTNQLEFSYDLFYAQREDEKYKRGFQISELGAWPNFVSPTPAGNEFFEGEISGNSMSAGSTNNKFVETESLIATGFNVYSQTDYWTVDADIAYSKSESDSRYDGIKSGNSAGGDIVTLLNDGSLNYNLDLTDPATNAPATLATDFQDVESEQFTVKLDARRELDRGILESLDFGFRASERNKEQFTRKGTANGVGTFDAYAIKDRATIDGIDYMIVDIDNVIANNFGGGVDPADFETGLNDLDAEEATVAGYAKFNFSRNFGDYGVIGNFGIRAVKVETESRGNLVDYVNWWVPVTAVEADNEYTEILPSMNLTFFPLHGKYALRFNAARKIAKPSLDKLNASTELYEVAGNVYAAGGNPDLDPWDIYQFDMSWDWEFMDKGFLSATATFKHLDTYIARGFEDETINGTSRNVLRPINAEDAQISSFAVRYNQPLSFIPGPFDNVGVFFSGILNHSNAEELHNNTETNITKTSMDNSYSLHGLADHSFISSIYYWMGEFSTELRYTYRSEYTYQTKTSLRSLATVDANHSLDFRMSYMPTDQFSVLFEVKNLNNSDFSYHYNNDERRQGGVLAYGRSYNIGVNYSF